MEKHIVQTKEWAEFKNNYGTEAVTAAGVVYTKHEIPFVGGYFAYCPRVDPFSINFKHLKASLKEHNCVSINFDVPNVLADTEESIKATDLFMENDCKPAARDQFAKANIILDLTKNEEELLNGMHPKHRYNIKYAQKKGVVVKKAQSAEDFNVFYSLFKETAERQKYFVRPAAYYKKLWNLFKPKNMAEILVAEYLGKPLATWMFLMFDDVLYYPYGGSSEDDKNLHASNIVAWEGIKMGKENKCKIFDMWGAAENTTDKNDPWWGFTNFKLKFGGSYVKYMDSYDFVINDAVYKMFSFANNIRWKVLKLLA